MQTKPNPLRAAMLGVQQADAPQAPSVVSLAVTGTNSHRQHQNSL